MPPLAVLDVLALVIESGDGLGLHAQESAEKSSD